MARVLLEDLKPGMSLGKPVYTLQGVLLIRGGEVLTERHLQMFRSWGIEEADVATGGAEQTETPEGGGEQAVPAELLASAQAEIAHRFRHADADADPAMTEIRRQAALRLAQHKRLQQGPAPLPAQETA